MALRFKLDENIPGEAAALLQGAGHDARTALEQKLGGSRDDRLFRECQEEARVLEARALHPQQFPRRPFWDTAACASRLTPNLTDT